mmetsp:Transcript_22000/g.38749  ORF Transcript_22000/g.38749 Transcript_22000/m.38749 type:complete len:310 (-) Transcript_22000:659-1588(-)
MKTLPTVVATRTIVPRMIRSNKNRPINRLPSRRGGLFMIPSSAGSTAATNPRVTAQIKLQYKTWTGVKGDWGKPQIIPNNTLIPWALLIGVLINKTFLKLSQTVRPSLTAYTMVAKLSSAKIISEASRATSVPSLPMATPMSAAFKAGASLTPSPVILEICPSFCRAFTIWILFCGEARAKMLYFITASQISSSDIASSSGPVTADEYFSSTNPNWSPMARAVSLWSPVIMATRTPAVWASAIAETHSGRGGSMIAQRPTIVNQGSSRPLTNSGFSWSPFLTSPFLTVPRQRAKTRSPWELRVAICSVQ